MKNIHYLCLAGLTALASCSSDDFVGDNNLQNKNKNGEISFSLKVPGSTRGDLVGATAAEKLGGNFIVEGTKGTEDTDAPSTDVVFDNYLVAYTENTAGTTESNTHNWEYVGKQAGTTLVPKTTWDALHNKTNYPTSAQDQSIKYWDFSEAQYDFIAYSTGTKTAVTGTPTTGQVQVTRIATGTTLSSTAFSFTAPSVDELKDIYVTDITKVPNASYKNVVTLRFKNLTSKIRVGLYETIPGYSVSDVQFYTDDATNLNADLSDAAYKNATLFSDDNTTNGIATGGTITVYYPHIGSGSNAETDYNKASVTVNPGSIAKTSTVKFGNLADFAGKEKFEADVTNYLGRTADDATYAGDKTKAYYQNVIPTTAGVTLTLRVNYTLTSTDGGGETIKVYGAKAVVPATYTKWQPNYAYTYLFKISDNTNGWTADANATSGDADKAGLFPITFDAVVASYEDATAEQTTITTVATPSITTYQQGHDNSTDEYSIATDNNVYVQVMDNSTVPATLVNTLSATNSLLFAVSGTTAKVPATEANIMDALLNRTNAYDAASPVGRNGITLTTNTNIDNTVDEIANGVNDDPITITAGEAAEIDISELSAGTYAYVYVQTAPTADEAIYQVVTPADDEAAKNYYEITEANLEAASACSAGAKAAANKVYFVANLNAQDEIVGYTFKQTKVNDDVEGLYEVAIPGSKATKKNDGSFYFDIYNQNNGKYAVKVIKVVA